jgi:hypothetical protein
VRAQVIAPGGSVVRDLGRLPHPGGRVVASWNGRDSRGRLAADGSYRLGVHLAGRTIHLLNPLVLDTTVRIAGTAISRRVFSPDCDSRADRVIVVVRGREQLVRLVLEVRRGGQLVRTVRVGHRARALAVSWPPYEGGRCRTVPDGTYQLRVIARDVPGNTRAIDVGDVITRGVVLSTPERAIVAGRRVRVGISSDARSLRLDLTRLGGRTEVLARGAHSPAAVARVPARSPGGVYLVSNRHAGRTATVLLSVRGAQPARVALLVAGQPAATLAAFQRRLDALGVRFDAFTGRDLAQGALDGYAAIVVPPGGEGAAQIAGVPVVRTLAGLRRGLGT